MRPHPSPAAADDQGERVPVQPRQQHVGGECRAETFRGPAQQGIAAVLASVSFTSRIDSSSTTSIATGGRGSASVSNTYS